MAKDAAALTATVRSVSCQSVLTAVYKAISDAATAGQWSIGYTAMPVECVKPLQLDGYTITTVGLETTISWLGK